jgi:hypothetical protein
MITLVHRLFEKMENVKSRCLLLVLCFLATISGIMRADNFTSGFPSGYYSLNGRDNQPFKNRNVQDRPSPPAEAANTINVKDFGAIGDGLSNDTEAIRAAIEGAADGLVEFPRGRYRITETIEVTMKEVGPIGLTGKGAGAVIIMDGKGPAFRFSGSHNGTADPESVKEITWYKERMPMIDALEIIGSNPEADGLEFNHTFMPVVRSVLIRNVRHGIHLTSRNRNIIITSCHVYHCGGTGIYLDSVNLHQAIISDSHLSFCSQGGIKISRSEIRNLQITGNDIEYNCDPEGMASSDILIDCSQLGSVREGTISGNTIQSVPSPGGANIRFTGPDKNSEQIGLWSITGNHISNQTVNIHLDRTHGISITGNTFIRGYDCHMIIDNSSNIVISSNVFDHNNDYFPKSISAAGGITVFKSNNLILTDNILDGVEYGTLETGGAITIRESGEISVRGSQIINPGFRGIYIEKSRTVRITDCIIIENEKSPGMLCGIEIKGICPGTVIRSNSIGYGKKGDIVNHTTGVIIEANLPAGSGSEPDSSAVRIR